MLRIAVKRELEDRYGEPVNHGRLYPNPDELVEYGLLTKSALDRRTNEYSPTEDSKKLLREYHEYVGGRVASL